MRQTGSTASQDNASIILKTPDASFPFPNKSKAFAGDPMGTDENKTAAQEKTPGGEVNYAVGSELDAAKKIAQLPTSMQARYNNLPSTAQRALIKK